MGQIAVALHFSPATTQASLAIFRVAQADARVIAAKWALSRNIARPAFLIVASFLALIADNSTTVGPFVEGVALSGGAFGVVWPLMVLII